MKELTEIRTKGTPPGIELLSADSMTEWIFTVAVLGDETVYRVSTLICRMPMAFLIPHWNALSRLGVRVEG